MNELLTIAEVADKSSLPEQPLLVGVVVGFLIVAVGSALATQRRWLAFIPVVLSGLIFWSWWMDLTDPQAGDALIAELGTTYFIRLAGLFGGPYLVSLVLLGLIARRMPVSNLCQRTGHCFACGYDLHGLPCGPCPECGKASGTGPA